LLSGFTDLELNALGDWTEEIKSSAKMPAHYAGSKEALSTKMKHLAYAIATDLASLESWEVIPLDALHAAVEAAEETVSKKISQDAVTRWQAKASPTSVKRSFNFVQQGGAGQGQRGGGEGRETCHATIGGKLLTKYLRNGTPLCSLYQSGECQEEDCRSPTSVR